MRSRDFSARCVPAIVRRAATPLTLPPSLNPALPAPEWYAPVNADEIARLWRAKAK